jgi:hypothetical protein
MMAPLLPHVSARAISTMWALEGAAGLVAQIRATAQHEGEGAGEEVIMAKAIEQLAASGWTVGHAALGLHGTGQGSVKQQTHDGDTIIVRTIGNLGVRFLGVDAPEISFTLPNGRSFIRLADERWEEFLRDPFAAHLPPFEPPLSPALVQDLRSRVGPGAAMNHHLHASAAEDALEAEVLNDLGSIHGGVPLFFGVCP